MIKTNNIYCILIVLGIVSCQDSKWQVSDYTTANGFTSGIEGPAITSEGIIYAVNFQQEGTIGKIMPDGSASLWTILPEGSTGNSIQLQRDGSLLVADYTRHQVLKIHPETKAVVTFAQDIQMNQPNDICLWNDTVLFASDPDWKNGTGNLWRIEPGRCILLEDSMGTTNGITLSPDKQFLYVNESKQRKVWRYRVSDSGILSDKKLWYQFGDYGLDGMKCDAEGKLYVARHEKGTIVVLSPEGKMLEEIVLKGKKPSNLVFSNDFKTLYATLQDRGCVEALHARSR